MSSIPTFPSTDTRLLELVSAARLSTYVDGCAGDLGAAVRLYAWNAAVSAALWQPLGHVEVALRNAMSIALAERQRRSRIARRHTVLWPDLAGAFPGAPDRRRETVEDPVARLHELRNRIAHHQPIWNRDLPARDADVLLVAGFLEADLPAWIARDCRVRALLRARPRP